MGTTEVVIRALEGLYRREWARARQWTRSLAAIAGRYPAELYKAVRGNHSPLHTQYSTPCSVLRPVLRGHTDAMDTCRKRH